MSDGFVQVAPDSTGKKLDASELSVAGTVVERERIVQADDADPAGLAPVRALPPAPTDYGSHVRVVPRQTAGDTPAIVAGETPLARVNDTPEIFVLGQVQPFSLTVDGRLRVATASESYNYGPWDDPEQFGTNIPAVLASLSAWG
jgi:hypothetical protein